MKARFIGCYDSSGEHTKLVPNFGPPSTIFTNDLSNVTEYIRVFNKRTEYLAIVNIKARAPPMPYSVEGRDMHPNKNELVGLLCHRKTI